MTVRVSSTPFPRPARASGIREGLSALAWHRILIQTGAAMLGMFLPMFLYQLFDRNMSAVLWYAFAYYLLAGLLEPLGAMVMTRIGMKNALRLGTMLYVFFFLTLALAEYIPVRAVVISSLLAISTWHVIYWVPYHTEFAEEGRGHRLGTVIGAIAAAGSLVGVVLPTFSGWVIETYGYPVLCLSALLVVFASLVPIGRVRATEEQYEFGFLQTFRELFAPARRRFLMTFAAEGAESVVGFFVWPVFLFELLRGEYVQAGMVTTAVGLLSIAIQILVGHLVDREKHRGRLLSFGMNLSAIGWILKSFVSSVAHIILFGTLHSFALILMRTPFEALMYAKAADAGHYVDEYTVLREMALSLGRVILLAVLLSLGAAFQFWIAFLITAAVTFFFGILSRKPPAFGT
ncbi:hypothetical protein A2348_01430 [Candidatus Uhrbacteria bacterium RIFOXYB12_FULL_58_10]|uniref:Major facilitator superfamily (MFS) profile domain-containing protein n=1 Tax=Candidatus Uhrbacteria bacterium RIFOXYB2_FULL_57_15 TaxID=1802422 RepID=A0A1F7W7I0_9BACT|nr:MAG: hypothetical protein A2348_01430 [Candidatus Uhrbacteria bacterium RIFOXYB12_FULL_58_10]OGL98044.1 MAG: hypothetical protein A2304_00860 [Candidatus Uhrbacteria bacterium RIFOXYB2_FULL_57_15]OGL99724.1 MAG: hypothetical protein A2501_00195 [Candidatus Uhrbacteria bacterium RIFOXYC12_FULL_57_11]